MPFGRGRALRTREYVLILSTPMRLVRYHGRADGVACMPRAGETALPPAGFLFCACSILTPAFPLARHKTQCLARWRRRTYIACEPPLYAFAVRTFSLNPVHITNRTSGACLVYPASPPVRHDHVAVAACSTYKQRFACLLRGISRYKALDKQRRLNICTLSEKHGTLRRAKITYLKRLRQAAPGLRIILPPLGNSARALCNARAKLILYKTCLKTNAAGRTNVARLRWPQPGKLHLARDWFPTARTTPAPPSSARAYGWRRRCFCHLSGDTGSSAGT